MTDLSRERLMVLAADPHAATEEEIRALAAELIMERSQSKVLATMARQHGDLLERVVALAGADTDDAGLWAAAVDQVVTEHLALRIRVREFQAFQRGVLAQFGRLGFDRYSRLVEGMEPPTDLADALDAVLGERDRLRTIVARVRATLAGHPRCDVHPDGDVVSCGWKRAVADVQAAVDEAEAATETQLPGDPPPGARCHCGAPAEYRSEVGVDWCWPCKYAGHETCECSEPANSDEEPKP